MEARSKYYYSLSEDEKLRYEEKIKRCGGIDPYVLKASDLSTERKDFPEMTLLDIGNYMIHSVSPFTKRAFKAYKSMEAYSFFESGFVTNIGSKKTNELTISKGTVKHSQRMNAAALKVWVLAEEDGEIMCAHCTCIAGLSETCSHVGAVCFAILSITEAIEDKSVTELLCKWNVPKFKDDSMSLVQDMKWTSSSIEQPTNSTKISSFVSSCESIRPFTDDIINNFIKNIPGGNSAMHSILFPDEKRRNSTIKDEIFLSTWYNENNKHKTLFELVEIGKSRPLKFSDEDLTEITRVTMRKSRFSTALMRGRINGSDFKDCCTTSIKNPSVTIINRLINPTKNLDHIPSVKFQNKNKKAAIKQYVSQEIGKHENFKYEECGLLVNPKTPYFISSADGFISCDCHGRGCIEIKCLKILETGESFDVLTHEPNNILYKLENEYFLEKTHSYFYKTHMQINLAELEYSDVVIWSPTKFLTLRIYPDIKFWVVAKQKALLFHQEVMLPELLGKFYTKPNGQPMEESEDEYLELVGLDIEFLHFDKE